MFSKDVFKGKEKRLNSSCFGFFYIFDLFIMQLNILEVKYITGEFLHMHSCYFFNQNKKVNNVVFLVK